MVAVIIIPLIVTSTIGIIGYLTYKIVIFDYLCNRSVNTTLKKYDIKKTQFQIIKEYYENKGEPVTEKVIDQLAKQYRQKEPEQFLAMYDSLRDKSKSG
jgi:aminoglycoside N3'-acetyltransferase